ncbi:MAG: hypothetical protein M3429_03805, partial [Verrucomicrobiota bacterium]|nr:hypothetical protein [Verrucomicrobiota bacterium]
DLMWLECAFLKWLAAVSLGVDFQSLFEASKAPLPSRGINQFAGTSAERKTRYHEMIAAPAVRSAAATR